MTKYSHYPYRQKTIGIVQNQEKEYLLLQLIGYKENEWNFPGGGIDPGESAQQAVLRELKEELGSGNFEIIKKSPTTFSYDWPDEVVEKREREKGEKYRGQNQSYFFVSFTGDKSEISTQDKEIRRHVWVKEWELKKYLIFPNQYESFLKVI